MEEDVPSGGDNIVTEFNTYEDFLDSQITSLDLYYLEVNRIFAVYRSNCLNHSQLNWCNFIVVFQSSVDDLSV